ncbi:hypothetical protein OV450_3377 [Actinobacteria bacterium OV450]|nr:hypothetical protein OV450_3377 [Actinobacteria bacterium OV450]
MTRIYFKATRLDGTDFRTGTVDYVSLVGTGRRLALKPARERFECCSDGVYHAADSPSETLIGGEWPCRLFEVAGSPVAQEDHKFGFRSLRVLREVEAWQALGTNGQAVATLIARASQLTEQEAGQLSAARSAARYAAGSAGGDAAWFAARSTAACAAVDAAWSAAGYAARSAGGYVAGSAAGDAAQALVVQDLITPEQFDLLYGPWRTVMDSGND